MTKNLVNFHEEASLLGGCKVFDKSIASSESSSSWFGAFSVEPLNPWVDCQLYIRKTVLLCKKLSKSPYSNRKPRMNEKICSVDLRKCYLHIIPNNMSNMSSKVSNKSNKELYLFEILLNDNSITLLFDAQTERDQSHFVNILREYVIGSKTRHQHHIHHHHRHHHITGHIGHSIPPDELDEIKFLFKTIPRKQSYLRQLMHQTLDILPYSILSTMKQYPRLGHSLFITLWIYYLAQNLSDDYDSKERRLRKTLETVVDEILGILPLYETKIIDKQPRQAEDTEAISSLVDILLQICDSFSDEEDDDDDQEEGSHNSANSNKSSGKHQLIVDCCSWYVMVQNLLCTTWSSPTTMTNNATAKSNQTVEAMQAEEEEEEEVHYHHVQSLLYQLVALCNSMKGTPSSPTASSSSSSSLTCPSIEIACT